MRQEDVLAAIKNFIEQEVLASAEANLEPDTPLLEWGILNSLNTARMLTFVREEFGINVPADRIVGAHLKNLDSISKLIVELADDPRARVPGAGQTTEHTGAKHG
ncbi:MAG TPA: acyl carrier protein [Streptosporangiaceae bacterium]|jgi:acyl carrier protein